MRLRHLCPLLLLTLSTAACGDRTGGLEGLPAWARLAPEQVGEARRLGVPAAFENPVGMRFVLVPSGTFWMGSPETEAGRSHDEGLREVEIARAFYLQVTEVTNAEYRLCVPQHESGAAAAGDRRPVVRVSHEDGVVFAAWLSRCDPARVYGLPTEAQWEYACRAGTRTAYWSGDDAADLPRHAWYHANAERRTHEVGLLVANPWGLHDMCGNVHEWCRDAYDPNGSEYTDPWERSPEALRVHRGGFYGSKASRVRSAVRYRSDPADRRRTCGLRMVSPVPQAVEAPR